MSNAFSDHYQKLREEAVGRVAQVLESLGFLPTRDRTWSGLLQDNSAQKIPVRVALPPDFPDVLPHIFLDKDHSSKYRAHIDQDGKLCIAPGSASLLDAERPEQILRDALEKACRILFDGAPSDQRREQEAEFTAYWSRSLSNHLSLCGPDTPNGEITLVPLKQPPHFHLLAPDDKAAQAWSQATGIEIEHFHRAYFIRFESLFQAPTFHERIRLRELFDLIRKHASLQTAEDFKTWLEVRGLPAFLLMAAPLSEGSNEVLFAARLPAPSGDAAQRMEHGFRPGKIPLQRIVRFAHSEAINPINVERMDRRFVVPRGGGSLALTQKTVVVVGCGSVGSHAASSLAASGLGKVLLIDPENLSSANIHRHVLGAADIGQNKAATLAQTLHRRFPHLSVESILKPIQETLEDPLAPLLEADLVLIALGDETLELRLNDFLRDRIPRVHVWVEPLGLGGHVLSTGLKGKRGCFQCLFRRDEIHGLVNMASLVQPGQNFQRTLCGCAGTFTPYGALDAQRAGFEAVRQVLHLLTDPDPSPKLTSWVTDRTALVQAGYELSPRGQEIDEGSVQIRSDFSRPDCHVC